MSLSVHVNNVDVQDFTEPNSNHHRGLLVVMGALTNMCALSCQLRKKLIRSSENEDSIQMSVQQTMHNRKQILQHNERLCNPTESSVQQSEHTMLRNYPVTSYDDEPQTDLCKQVARCDEQWEDNT